ncbi:hypothetical protein T12_13590 [Trichinella patagoniensis]|uniref:Uncharacterized protein n=1 Tax=Trichinella patagoniensis TaxID=990121 RepID=A0A0V0ZS93_9BILA|nr:hypothetical protein T12_13590 [Trichinella patagoniensis]
MTPSNVHTMKLAVEVKSKLFVKLKRSSATCYKWRARQDKRSGMAARISPERRAALLQYLSDDEVRGVMRAMHVQETDDYDGLKSALYEAFRVPTGSERFSGEFFQRKQKRGESVLVYAGQLR